MQTPSQRKQLILEGRYDQLEPPPNLGFGFLNGFAAHSQQIPASVRAVFGGADRASGEREPGEDG